LCLVMKVVLPIVPRAYSHRQLRRDTNRVLKNSGEGHLDEGDVTLATLHKIAKWSSSGIVLQACERYVPSSVSLSRHTRACFYQGCVHQI
jgi:hypothetical protein